MRDFFRIGFMGLQCFFSPRMRFTGGHEEWRKKGSSRTLQSERAPKLRIIAVDRFLGPDHMQIITRRCRDE